MTVDSDRMVAGSTVWSPYLVLALFTALLLIPLTYYGFSGERARWKLAQARLLEVDGQPLDAIDQLEAARALTPGDDELQLELSRLLMQHGQADRALALIDQVLDNNRESRRAMEMKANCLVYLGRTEEALTTAKQTFGDTSPGQNENPHRLNYRAYFRALAGKELGVARREIDRAGDRTAKEMWWLDGLPMSLKDQTLVATAMVARHVDQAETILPVLDRRIEFYEDLIVAADRRLPAVVYQNLMSDFPMTSKQESQVRREVITIRAEERFLAILLSVRALINQDLDRRESSDRDRMRVQQLGLEAETLISQLPDDWQFLQYLYNGGQLLDTRALVKFQTSPRQWRSALGDLEIGVMALEVLNRSSADAIQNTVRNESGDIYDAADIPRQLATLLKHRVQLFQGMDEDAKAQCRPETYPGVGVWPGRCPILEIVQDSSGRTNQITAQQEIAKNDRRYAKYGPGCVVKFTDFVHQGIDYPAEKSHKGIHV